MTVIVKYEDPSAVLGVREKRFEGVQHPLIMAPGFFVLKELKGDREAFIIPLQRIVDVEYSDNVVSLLENLG